MISVFRSSKCGWRCGRALVGLVDVRIQNIKTLKTGFKFVITYVLRRQRHESAANSGQDGEQSLLLYLDLMWTYGNSST